MMAPQICLQSKLSGEENPQLALLYERFPSVDRFPRIPTMARTLVAKVCYRLAIM